MVLQSGHWGCLQALWNEYVQAMQRGGFSADTPMYVASGLLTYGANDGALMLAVPCCCRLVCHTSCARRHVGGKRPPPTADSPVSGAAGSEGRLAGGLPTCRKTAVRELGAER